MKNISQLRRYKCEFHLAVDRLDQRSGDGNQTFIVLIDRRKSVFAGHPTESYFMVNNRIGRLLFQ
ncbi:hypothetical protein GZ78_21115 [Endozoicomonas numazuensis]|uniref:Uncharacterized protein n=1 Tax=Endozoicomonas numazuensis TaxID=1137799 RepID=A0A081ND59_9GAMM|nr:hypothetical protein GZ78_21115 [Endozoicomonas numazuensis]